ncbi:hypothetical protein [Raoultibacter timonensis]|uniref:hypothetical protein n=1 Tax=Raoultibacter timonensis TaxID=1907662 RepID=UPI0026DBDB86|nr:hypothetical protein [Raoultibacter timonensis]
MPDKPLTQLQKQRLAELEPKLRQAAKHGNYAVAKNLAASIQEILREAGYETRLMQAKNWLFQAAMEQGQLETARMGFEGIRKKTSSRTRVYLEATALEAMCLLKKGDMKNAEPLMKEALDRTSNIRSKDRRQQFQKRMVESFEREWTLSLLRQDNLFELNVDQVQSEAAHLLQTLSEEGIESNAVNGIPREKLYRLFDAYNFSRNQLPSADRLRLPSPESRANDQEVGKTLIESVKRVLWRSLCDEKSPVYQMWFDHGMMYLLDKKYLTAAVVAAMAQLNIGYFALAASVSAILFKTGIEIFCDRCEPADLMIEKADKR